MALQALHRPRGASPSVAKKKARVVDALAGLTGCMVRGHVDAVAKDHHAYSQVQPLSGHAMENQSYTIRAEY